MNYCFTMSYNNVEFDLNWLGLIVQTGSNNINSRRRKMRLTLIVGIVIGILRIVIGMNFPPQTPDLVSVYKDIAHLFMGGLAVALYRDRKEWQSNLFWGLCFLEVLAAILSRAC